MIVSSLRKEPFLSKSKYLAGLKCLKLLWMHYHAKDQFPPTDPETQARFDQGHRVTRLFQTLFPGGIEIPGADDFDQVIQETQSALSLKKPLFEPGFRYKNTYARADVLVPGRDGRWDLYEVKSASKVKDTYYPDVAFQKYCYEGAGIRIRKTYLVHINNEYILDGALDPKALFTQEDITDEIGEWVDRVEPEVDRMMEVLKLAECPQVKIGVQCDDPYECPLKSLCWQHIPEDSVFVFNKIRRDKAFAFIDDGFLRAQDVPLEQLKSTSHQIVYKCHVENKIHTDRGAIRAFIKRLEFPVHFIDFETVGAAIPLYNGTRPFQQVPFQFSLHISSGPDQELKHHAFLAKGAGDPRPEFLSRLRAFIGPKGTILAYNLSFERGKLQDSVDAYPEYKDWLNEIDERLLDLMAPFQKFDFYDPKQLGMYSIKSVYPALIGGSYEGMTISDGSQASREYARVTFSDGITEEDRRRVYDGLLEYCKLDTQAMIDVLKVLQSVADPKG